MRNNHPVGDPVKHSREVWVEMFCQSLQNLTLLKSKKKKKFILLHCLRQETLFYDPEPFRFAYIDIMEPREDKGDREGIPHTHSIP